MVRPNLPLTRKDFLMFSLLLFGPPPPTSRGVGTFSIQTLETTKTVRER